MNLSHDTKGIKTIRFGAVASGVALLAIAAIPVSNFVTRALALFLVPVLWVLLAALAWPKRWLCLGLLAGGALCLGGVVGPGRAFSAGDLQNAVCRELLAYEGTPYVWGGENRFGIDCSGLVRCALVNAAIKRGVVTGNPALVRFGLSLWWHDCSARDLGQGHRGLTVPVGSFTSVNATNPSVLQPADLAVTATGVHVLAYVGADTWVEADPTAHRVLVAKVPEPGNWWFQVPVRVERWQVLARAPAAPVAAADSLRILR
jgi:hypothetical protein